MSAQSDISPSTIRRVSDVTARNQPVPDGESLTEREMHSRSGGLDLFKQSGAIELGAEVALQIHELITNTALKAAMSRASQIKRTVEPFREFGDSILSLQNSIQTPASKPYTDAFHVTIQSADLDRLTN